MSRVPGACMSALALCLSLSGVARAQVADRYGPSAPSYVSAPSSASDPGSNRATPQAGPQAALAGAPMRMLSWPGKVALATPSMTQDAPAAYVSAASVPAANLSVPDRRPAPAPVRWAAPSPQPQPVRIATAAVPTAVAPRVYSAPAPALNYRSAVADTPRFEAAPAPAPAPFASSPHYGLVQAMPRQLESAPSIYDAPAAPRASTRIATAGPAPQAKAAPAPSSTAAATPAQAGAPPPAPALSASATPADAAHPGWAPPRHAWSQASDTGVRFYSLHRQYGVAPDPAPIPPQFFAATADLGEPAGPMTRTISGAGSAAQAARAVQAAQAETSSDTASSQP